MASLFAAVEMAPRDPILGLNEQFNADPNPAKVNLGVGVYFDDEGQLPLLKCVAAAEKQMVEAPQARNYLPIDGIAAYDRAVQGLVFGADNAAVKARRIATVQAVGGGAPTSHAGPPPGGFLPVPPPPLGDFRHVVAVLVDVVLVFDKLFAERLLEVR